MTRMTRISKTNLQVADACGIVWGVSGWMICVSVDENRSYIHGSDDFPIEYKTKELARRAIKRIRPDLEPSTI